MSALAGTPRQYLENYDAQAGKRVLMTDVVARRLATLSKLEDAQLSPLGKLFKPAMLEAGIGPVDLAAATSVSAQCVWSMLHGSHVPQRPAVARIAGVLPVDELDVERAYRETRELAGPRQSGGFVGKILHREGRAGLSRRSKAQASVGGAVSDDAFQRSLVSRQRWFATMTEAERLRWSIQHLHSNITGRWGVCRICGKWTHTYDKRLSNEVHQYCYQHWSPFGQWMRAHRGNRNAGEMPIPSYPRKKRPRPEEIADLYRLTVRYFKTKLSRQHGAVRLLALEFLPLATSGDGAERELRRRVNRFLAGLPERKTCSEELARRVRLLRLIAQVLGLADDGSGQRGAHLGQTENVPPFAHVSVRHSEIECLRDTVGPRRPPWKVGVSGQRIEGGDAYDIAYSTTHHSPVSRRLQHVHTGRSDPP